MTNRITPRDDANKLVERFQARHDRERGAQGGRIALTVCGSHASAGPIARAPMGRDYTLMYDGMCVNALTNVNPGQRASGTLIGVVMDGFAGGVANGALTAPTRQIIVDGMVGGALGFVTAGCGVGAVHNALNCGFRLGPQRSQVHDARSQMLEHRTEGSAPADHKLSYVKGHTSAKNVGLAAWKLRSLMRHERRVGEVCEYRTQIPSVLSHSIDDSGTFTPFTYLGPARRSLGCMRRGMRNEPHLPLPQSHDVGRLLPGDTATWVKDCETSKVVPVGLPVAFAGRQWGGATVRTAEVRRRSDEAFTLTLHSGTHNKGSWFGTVPGGLFCDRSQTNSVGEQWEFSSALNAEDCQSLLNDFFAGKSVADHAGWQHHTVMTSPGRSALDYGVRYCMSLCSALVSWWNIWPLDFALSMLR
ncbi:MAG: hypothetical protein EOO40_08365, partial [Deltaproteobacteria bacterium]